MTLWKSLLIGFFRVGGWRIVPALARSVTPEVAGSSPVAPVMEPPDNRGVSRFLELESGGWIARNVSAVSAHRRRIELGVVDGAEAELKHPSVRPVALLLAETSEVCVRARCPDWGKKHPRRSRFRRPREGLGDRSATPRWRPPPRAGRGDDDPKQLTNVDAVAHMSWDDTQHLTAVLIADEIERFEPGRARRSPRGPCRVQRPGRPVLSEASPRLRQRRHVAAVIIG